VIPAFRVLFPRFSRLRTVLSCWYFQAATHFMGMTLKSTLSKADEVMPTLPQLNVTLAPWVNEPFPPFQDLLSAHDVARLTRRPKLVITGLTLLRRFPQKRQYRGRNVGWLRSDIVDWLTRDVSFLNPRVPSNSSSRRCAKGTPQQPCLPLECNAPCSRPQRPCSRRPRGSK
jgi:hypothetical protein